MSYPDITMATQTIHNPGDPRHFMRVKPVPRLVRVHRAGALLAESRNAMRVTELGKDMYDPVIYLPMGDVQADLSLIDGKTSHCPLKGDAVYYALPGQDPIAWSYDAPFDFSMVIKGLIGFYPDEVTVEEVGAQAG